MTTQENLKVNVKGGRYVGKKWFLKIAYKMFETDVDFFDDKITLSKGTGFAKVTNKVNTNIKYKDIISVTTKKKYSVPNIITGTLIALLCLLTGAWVGLLIAALIIWIGSTAVTEVQHINGVFEIPTEFKSEADELQTKIYTAINQSR